MALITYEDKETLINNPVLEKYKCTAENLNEIKAGINTNETNIGNLVDRLDMIDDTRGANWQDMMKNKLDYCINNINTTKTNIETFINGGWYGSNYGFGVFSKLGPTYQLVWFSSDGIYYCRNVAGVYDYRNILWTNS